MATDVQNRPEESTASLMSGIVQDAQDLFKQHLDLFKAEVKQDVMQASRGAMMFALGAGLNLMALLVLVLGVVQLLAYYAPGLPLWACYFIVGGGMAVLGVSLVVVVAMQLQKAKPLSETTAGLEETAEWKTSPK